MIAKSAVTLPVLVVAAVLVLHRFGGDPGRLLDAAAHGSGLGGAYLRPGGYTGEGWVGAVNRIGQIFGMSMATLAMPAVLMRAISTKSPRGARTVGRWMLGELTLLYAALAVVASVRRRLSAGRCARPVRRRRCSRRCCSDARSTVAVSWSRPWPAFCSSRRSRPWWT